MPSLRPSKRTADLFGPHVRHPARIDICVLIGSFLVGGLAIYSALIPVYSDFYDDYGDRKLQLDFMYFTLPVVSLLVAILNLVLYFTFALHPVYTLIVHCHLGLGWIAEAILLGLSTAYFFGYGIEGNGETAHVVVMIILCVGLFWCSVAYITASIAALVARNRQKRVTLLREMEMPRIEQTTEQPREYAGIPAPTYEPRASPVFETPAMSSIHQPSSEEHVAPRKTAFERIATEVDGELEGMKKL